MPVIQPLHYFAQCKNPERKQVLSFGVLTDTSAISVAIRKTIAVLTYSFSARFMA